MRLVLLNHGDAADVHGRCVGRTDVPLTDAARLEAEALARSWPYAAPDALLCSTRRRAHTMLAPFARRFARLPQHDPRLDEQDFGEWDGRPWRELADTSAPQLRDWLADWIDHAAPAGESFRALETRVADWLDALASDHPPDALLLVSTHAGPIRALLCRALAMPLERALQLDLAHGRVTALRQRRGRFELSYFNASRFEASLSGDDPA